MCMRREIYWCIHFQFLRKKFMWWWTWWRWPRTLKIRFQIVFDSLGCVFAWISLFLCHEAPVTAFHVVKWNDAFHVGAPKFKNRVCSILIQGNSSFGFLAFISIVFTCLHASFSIFHFFYHIKNSITQKIQIQIPWFFLHNVHHVVYFFMDIFSRIVHGWKK